MTRWSRGGGDCSWGPLPQDPWHQQSTYSHGAKVRNLPNRVLDFAASDLVCYNYSGDCTTSQTLTSKLNKEANYGRTLCNEGRIKAPLSLKSQQ